MLPRSSCEAAIGCLKNFDEFKDAGPIEDIRCYLAARYESRFSVSPRLFESTVASVFRDQGYLPVVTGYSNDGGIDIILHRCSHTIGVQVKRHRQRIQVEMIRSLAGALVLHDMTTGIFVTTSDFTMGATRVTSAYSARGIAIELLDAPRFYSALSLVQVSRHHMRTKDPSLYFSHLVEYAFDGPIVAR